MSSPAKSEPAPPAAEERAESRDVVAPAPRADDVAATGEERAVADDQRRPLPRPTVDADRAFDALARAQLLRLANGNGGGLAGAGSGVGGVGIGLATELSGRRVEKSPVMTAPVMTEARSVECNLLETLYLRAMIRVLVTRQGTAAVPRVLRPSGHEQFDRCALDYVRAMRFAPGTSDRGQPLDVWMNVEVSTRSAPDPGN
jgi:TonB family protein